MVKAIEHKTIAISFKGIDEEIYKRFKILCVEQGIEMRVKVQELMQNEVKARDRAREHGL